MPPIVLFILCLVAIGCIESSSARDRLLPFLLLRGRMDIKYCTPANHRDVTDQGKMILNFSFSADNQINSKFDSCSVHL